MQVAQSSLGLVTNFWVETLPEIILRTGEHLVLVAIAMTIAIIIGLPLGILITRQPKLAQPILGLTNAIQTIPSLAIFGFLLSVPFFGGIGKIPAIVALMLYALLPLIRNTYIGISTVNPAIREAGQAMGMTDLQLLTQVELPLASGVILAGVRVATVISVGIATIAAAIGGGGLGVFIFRGIATVNNDLILAGAIPAALMALIADFGLGKVEAKIKEPPKYSTKYSRSGWKTFFLTTQSKIIILIMIIGITGLVWVLGQAKSNSPTITIGSKNFTEQVILGEILAQQIEAKTNLHVDRRFNLGGTFICHEAVKAGQIAGYVEYTGTALTAILKRSPSSDANTVYGQVKADYEQKFNLAVLPSLGFNNTFAMIIRGEDARKLTLKTLSDSAKYTPQWEAGFGYEFMERQDGYPGLAKTYGLAFSRVRQMELGLMYQALKEKQVDLIAAAATDGLIPVLDLVILEDDKKYFPPYEAVPVFNQAILKKYPEIETSIRQLSGKISTAAIQKMNYQVENQHESASIVARDWLKKNIS